MPNDTYDEISLRDLLDILLRHKKLILICTLLFTLFAAGLSLYQLQGGKSAQLIVSFNYDGISENKNPDGTAFDPYQIISPYILSDVIRELHLDGTLSTNTIRSLAEIQPIIPEEIQFMQSYAIENTGQALTYYPNEFMLSIRANVFKGVDAELSRRIANQIVNSYRDYFSNTYLSQETVPNKLVTFSADDYDYADISQVLHSQIDAIKNYAQAHNALSPDFRSKRTGMTFSDIYYALDILDEVEINRIDSMISAYKLTKNKEMLIIYYEYLIQQLEYQKAKYSAETTVSTAILNEMEDSGNALTGAIIGDSESTSAESYFSSLILRTADLGKDSSSIQQNIDFYKAEVNDLKSGNYVVAFNKESVTAKTDEMIQSVDTQLRSWIEITNDTADEFYDHYLSGAFYALSPAEVYSSVHMGLNLSVGIIMGLFVGIFLALFKSYWYREEGEHAGTH